MSTRPPLVLASWAAPATVSVALFTAAVAAFSQAVAHTQSLGVICGQSSTVHCGWCAVAVAASVGAAVALAWAMNSAARRP